MDYTMRYQVIQRDDLPTLMDAVNEQIEAGYIPVGGVEKNGQRFMQAMYDPQND